MKKNKLALGILLSFLISVSLLGSERRDMSYLDELYQQRRFELAVSESERFLNTYPRSRHRASILERVGKTYFLLERYEKAIEYLRLYLGTSGVKNGDEINYYIMRSYAILGNKGEADRFQGLISQGSEYYQRGLYEVGMLYVSRDDYNSAKAKLDQVISSRGGYTDNAALGMALMAFNISRNNEVLNYLNQLSVARMSEANKSLVGYLYGAVYYRDGKLNEAARSFEEVVQREVTSEYGKKSLVTLVEVYGKLGNEAKLNEAVTRTSDANVKDEIAKIVGDSYANRGSYERALSFYQMVANTRDLHSIYGKGYALYKLNRRQEALVEFNRLAGTAYYPRSLYYIFAIDYDMKNYRKIVDNRALVNQVTLSREDRDNINAIIANSAYELGDSQLAYGLYKNIYDQNPTRENLYRIIVLASQNNDFPALDGLFDSYEKSFPEDEEYKSRIYRTMGNAYYQNGQSARAVDVYKKYLENAEDAMVLENLISILLNTQNYRDMLTYVEMAESSLENTYLKGIANVGLGNYEVADMHFVGILSDANITNELSNRTKFNRVRNFFLWEKYNDAITHGEEYLTLEGAPDKEEVIDRVAVSYFRLDNFEKSREYYGRLLENSNLVEYGKFQIAESYYGERNLERAKEEYKKVYEEYPDGEYGERSYYWYLNVLANAGEMETFNNEKDIFLERYPNSPMRDNILMLSGAIYEHLNDSAKAIEYYRNLYSTSRDENIRDGAGEKVLEMYITLNETEAAKEFLNSIPDSEIKTYYTSVVYSREGNSEGAYEQNLKLLESERYKSYANINLGMYYFNQNDFVKSREYYNNIVDAESSTYKDIATFQLANIDEREGNLEEAFRGYTRGYVMYQGNYFQISKVKAGEMAEKLNNLEEALTIYTELHQLGDQLVYREVVLEKLIVYSLGLDKKSDARKYYSELSEINRDLAIKYEQSIN